MSPRGWGEGEWGLEGRSRALHDGRGKTGSRTPCMVPPHFCCDHVRLEKTLERNISTLEGGVD